MNNQGNNKPSLIAPLGGVVVGIAVFLGVNITIGRAIIPTPENVANPRSTLSEPVRPASENQAVQGPTDTYHTVCITCHQAEGQGIAGAFPPLAGSEWLNANPELPIRIVLLGLAGAIEVKGAKFNALMPPPPGLTDEKIAEAITFARSHFGNNSSKVDKDMVAKVRASLAGRTTSLTTDELRALRTSMPADGAAAPAGGAPAAAPEGAAPASAPAAPAPKAKPARKAAKPAAAAPPAAQPAAAPQ